MSSHEEIASLRARVAALEKELDEATQALDAIRSGGVDALVVAAPDGDRIYTLEGADFAYRALVEQMQEGAATLTVSGVLLFANQSLARLLGCPLESVVGRSFEEFLDEPSRIAFRGLLEACGATRTTSRAEVHLAASEGREVPASIGLQAFDAYGRPTLSMTVTDLTEQKALARAEARREADERYRLAVRATNDAIWDLNLLTGELHHNEAYITTYGAPPEPTGIEWWIERIRREDRGRVVDGLRAALAGTAEVWTAEYGFRRADGTWAMVEDRAYVARDAAGKAHRAIGAMSDVTERRNAEEAQRTARLFLEESVAARTAEVQHLVVRLRGLALELTEAEHRERRRIARVLHDGLQQFLVAAKLHLGLLRGRVEAENLESAVQRADELLDESINASRNLAVELCPPVLHDGGLVAGLDWLRRRMKEEYGLKVALAADTDVEPGFENARGFVYEAVRELLFNVVKHAGVLECSLTLRRVGADLEVRVEDAGKGAEPGSDGEAGCAASGMGLFSVGQRAEALGGALTIESAPGQGTRVTMRVPIAPPVAHAPHTHEPVLADALEVDAGARGRAGTVRLVLADDHAVVRQGFAALLRAQPDIDVVGEAANGAEAVDLARRLRPDLVVMDVSMPIMNGVDATRRIAREAPGVRVIGLSMYDEEMSAAMRDAGACAFVTKGGPSEVLIAAIRAAVRPAH